MKARLSSIALVLAGIVALFALAGAAFGQTETQGSTEAESKQKPTKLTKAQLKQQKQAAREAAREAMERADHASYPFDTNITAGCVLVDNIVFHRDVQRGWGGLFGGGSNAMLGVVASVSGIIHNNSSRPLTVNLAATFFDGNGVRVGDGSLQVLVTSERYDFSVPDSSGECMVLTANPDGGCVFHSAPADRAATLQIY